MNLHNRWWNSSRRLSGCTQNDSYYKPMLEQSAQE
jgi:hypothetical protein